MALSIWGVAYLVECFDVLTAPGHGLLLRTQGRGGLVTLEADSYAIDVRQGGLVARGVSVTAPSGLKTAIAESLVLRVRHLWGGGPRLVDAELRNVEATLERDVKGRFSLFDILPPETEQPSTQPFQVDIKNAVVHLIDRSEGSVWTETLRIPWAAADGVGDSWRASGRAVQEDGGYVQAVVRRAPGGGLDLQGRLEQAELARWLGPVRRTKGASDVEALHDLSAAEIRASGPFEVHLPEEGTAKVRARLTAQGRAVRYQDLFAQLAKVEAEGTGEGLRGVVDLSGVGAKGHFAGVVNWADGPHVKGLAELTLPNRSAIPSRWEKSLPAELKFRNASFDGAVDYDDQAGLAYQGQISAAAAAWGEQATQGLSATVVGNENRVAVRNLAADYRQSAITGSVDVNLKEESIVGFARAKDVPIQRFREQTGLDRVYGPTTVEAFVQGPFKRLNVEVRAKGDLSTEIESGRVVSVGSVEALAHYANNSLKVDRLAIDGPLGAATATGTVELPKGRLDLDVSASGIDLSQLNSKLAGTAMAKVHVRGTTENYVAAGPVEVYGLELEGQPVPLASATLRVTPQQLVAEDVRATRGAGRLRGEVAWNFQTGALDGDFYAQSFQLHDFVAEGIEGSLDLTNGVIAGTMEKPTVRANFAGSDMVASGIRLDNTSGEVRLEGSRIDLTSGRANIGRGSVDVQGTYDLETRRGTISGRLEDVPLNRSAAVLPEELLLAGQVSGEFSAVVEDGQLASATTAMQVQDLEVNRTFVGSGDITLQSQGKTITGSAEIGQPERYLRIEDLNYNTSSKVIDAQVTAYGLPIRDMYLAAAPFFSAEAGRPEPQVTLSPELRSFVERTQGNVDLDVRVFGDVGNPNLNIDSLLVRDTVVDGEPAGRIQASATRKDQIWSIPKFQWTGGPGILDITGTVDEEGPANLDGNLYNFNADWLARFVPAFRGLTGEASLFFSVTGPSHTPQIEASFTGSLFEKGAAAEDKDKRLNMEIYPILITDGAITMDGTFAYRGFTGTVKGNVPFQYPMTLPEDQPLTVTLQVEPRPLDGFVDLVPNLDPDRTEGTFTANVALTGTKGNLGLVGSARLVAAQAALKGKEGVLQAFEANANLDGHTLRVDVKSESSKGGSLSGEGRVVLGEFDKLLGDPNAYLAQKVEANLRAENLNVRFQVGEDESEVSGRATGGVRISGTVGKPIVSTVVPLALENVKGEIPSEFAVGEEAEPWAIQPQFNVAYVLGTRDKPAQVSAAASQLSLYGSGILKGQLDDLHADAQLRLRSGTIRLPNARINLEEGGSVRVLYESGFESPEFRVDVDIEGTTSLSTVRFGNLIEHYDIYLQIRGNLLDASEQLLSARSDPPDLSQERILSLLGQIELFESLSSRFTGTGQSRGQFERALTGLALPLVLDPVTEGLAKSLGLQYLSLDYGPLGQTSVTAAKWLGKGFSIIGRREIGEPLDGIVDYDLRLTYRPPRRIRTLRDLTFSVGIDQDRPWKIAVDYVKRIGNLGPADPSRITPIGPVPPKTEPPK